MERKKTNFLALAICILIPLAVGFVSSMLTRNAQIAYARMALPPLSPPSWLFPIVWTILYILMGIASYLIYMSDNPCNGTALTMYAIQLVMNFFWSLIFFRSGTYWLAAVWLFVMWLIILLLIIFVKNISRGAFFLLMPYILWCTFALYLNIGVAVLNK